MPPIMPVRSLRKNCERRPGEKAVGCARHGRVGSVMSATSQQQCGVAAGAAAAAQGLQQLGTRHCRGCTAAKWSDRAQVVWSIVGQENFNAHSPLPGRRPPGEWRQLIPPRLLQASPEMRACLARTSSGPAPSPTAGSLRVERAQTRALLVRRKSYETVHPHTMVGNNLATWKLHTTKLT